MGSRRKDGRRWEARNQDREADGRYKKLEQKIKRRKWEAEKLGTTKTES